MNYVLHYALTKITTFLISNNLFPLIHKIIGNLFDQSSLQICLFLTRVDFLQFLWINASPAFLYWLHNIFNGVSYLGVIQQYVPYPDDLWINLSAGCCFSRTLFWKCKICNFQKSRNMLSWKKRKEIQVLLPYLVSTTDLYFCLRCLINFLIKLELFPINFWHYYLIPDTQMITRWAMLQRINPEKRNGLDKL